MSIRKLRSKVLAEWRGYPQTRSIEDRFVKLNDVLTKVMHQFGLKEHLQETEVIQAWQNLVGEFIAANATPMRFKEGVLYVRVLQPSVHFELERHWKSQILQKFKAQFGNRMIREIKFRIG